MKWLIAMFLMSSAYALEKGPGDPVYIRPRLWVLGNSVQVEIWNSTQTDIQCRGSVHLNGSRRFESQMYYEVIYRGMSRTTTYRLSDWQDRLVSASDFINCSER